MSEKIEFDLKEYLEAKFAEQTRLHEAHAATTAALFKSIGNKVDGLGNKVDALGNKVDGIESKVVGAEIKFGRLDNNALPT